MKRILLLLALITLFAGCGTNDASDGINTPQNVFAPADTTGPVVPPVDNGTDTISFEELVYWDLSIGQICDNFILGLKHYTFEIDPTNPQETVNNMSTRCDINTNTTDYYNQATQELKPVLNDLVGEVTTNEIFNIGNQLGMAAGIFTMPDGTNWFYILTIR